MTSNNLGSKRVCPKCDAKFYDFGVVKPIQCPKCPHKWAESGRKKAAPAAGKINRPVSQPVRKPLHDDDDLLKMAGDLPEVDDTEGTIELEQMEDDGVEMTSLEELSEHEESEESDQNSDDAGDDMFTQLAGDSKIVDDFEDDDGEDEEEVGAVDDDEDNDGDEDDDRPNKRRH